MEKFCFEKAGKFVGRGGTRSCEARFPSPHPTPPGTPLCYALECVNLSAQPDTANTAAYRHLPIHAKVSPRKGNPTAKVSPRKGNPTAKVSPRKGKSSTAKVSPLERKRPPPGASVRRPTLYNIWYNFLIIFINNTITCIL